MPQPSGDHSEDAQALQLAYDRLKQQAQFQAGFLGTASHELRAPINQIISLHQLILEDLCENPAEEREFLTQANQTMQTVLKNLDLLINLSKLDIGTVQPQLQPVLLASLVANVQQLVEKKCVNRYCRLTIGEIDPELLAESDVQWLRQLLVTLIDAALGSGSTAINLAIEAQDDDQVEVALGCDRPISEGSEQVPDPSDRGVSMTAVSPEFHYQLAVRMVAHLKGEISQSNATNGGGNLIQIILPRGSF
ncbi:MAG: sensor histidine kinase [Nodosilinea sp.]